MPDELRAKAIFWIGQSDDPESGAYLRGLFGRIKSTELRKKLLFSVSQQDTRESRSWLLTVARDATQPLEIRKQALDPLGQPAVPLDLVRPTTALRVLGEARLQRVPLAQPRRVGRRGHEPRAGPPP